MHEDSGSNIRTQHTVAGSVQASGSAAFPGSVPLSKCRPLVRLPASDRVPPMPLRSCPPALDPVPRIQTRLRETLAPVLPVEPSIVERQLEDALRIRTHQLYVESECMLSAKALCAQYESETKAADRSAAMSSAAHAIVELEVETNAARVRDEFKEMLDGFESQCGHWSNEAAQATRSEENMLSALSTFTRVNSELDDFKKDLPSFVVFRPECRISKDCFI
jgi:hypothetical protein